MLVLSLCPPQSLFTQSRTLAHSVWLPHSRWVSPPPPPAPGLS